MYCPVCTRRQVLTPSGLVCPNGHGFGPAESGRWTGVSVNLSVPGPEGVFELELPVPPLWVGRQGAVIEVVFWAEVPQRWVHGVSLPFERELPEGHVQASIGDLEWMRQIAERWGAEGIRWCADTLVHEMEPVG